MSYYHEGYDAAQNGLGWHRCPYRMLTAAYEYWMRGWDAGILAALEA